MATIPASQIVNIVPSVISAGGTALQLNGLMLTLNTRVPIGTVPSFPTAAAVATYFGAGSTEATLAASYFNGFLNSNTKPGALLFSQYNQTAVAAYLRGGSVSGLTLAALQALSGTVIVQMDGYTHTSATINLATASSFSIAASLIQTGLNATQPQAATASAATISGNVLTVAGTLTGTFAVGQTVTGTGVTANSIITALGTGLGGVGTYTLSQTSTVSSGTPIVASGTAVTVAYDSVSSAFVITSGITGVASTAAFATGTLATSLALTSATGAVLSQGAAAATPAAAMNAIIGVTQNWCSFMTVYETVTTEATAFIAWTTSTTNRYMFAFWTTDVTNVSTSGTTSVVYQAVLAGASGTAPIYAPINGATAAAFLIGAIASIDYTQNNGRATMAFKSQSGLSPDVTSGTVAANLDANGLNFYGIYSTAAQNFSFLYPGSVLGPFAWIDSYVNQIWLNNQFQLSLMTLLTNVKSIPYTPAGATLIKSALQSVIQQAGNFGVFAPGVALSALQIAEVNAQAGNTGAATAVQNQGYYLQVGVANSQVRAARGSPPITFFYADGESVQSFNVASVLVQ